MGKSIRSKREKRLRTLRRELVADHYQKKEDACQAVLAVAIAGPPAKVQSCLEVETMDAERQPRSSVQPALLGSEDKDVVMEGSRVPESLKGKGGIKKKRKGKIGKRLEKKLKRQAEFPL